MTINSEDPREYHQHMENEVEYGGLHVSERAWSQMSRLDPTDRDKVIDGVCRAYRKITDFLVATSIQSFLSREQTFQLNYLTNKFQTIVAEDRPVTISICSTTLKWTIENVGEVGSLGKFEVIKLV